MVKLEVAFLYFANAPKIADNLHWCIYSAELDKTYFIQCFFFFKYFLHFPLLQACIFSNDQSSNKVKLNVKNLRFSLWCSRMLKSSLLCPIDMEL